jgi:membrane protease YdiL (CAAX protease family)
VIVAGFEELAFRGFLIPRLKVLLGNWKAAVLVSAVLFGLGHFYEGTLAVVQTAVLGAYFGFVFIFLRRFRLPSVMLAHAAFNTVNFAFMVWLQRSGLLEKLTGQQPPTPP